MIQRIQTLYLSLIALITLIFLSGNILSFSNKTGAVIKVTFNGIFRDIAGQSPEMIEKLFPLAVLIILIPVISLFAIFIFKNRKIQLRLTWFLIILASVFVIALIHVSFSVISKFEVRIIPGIKMILPLLILILSILSYRGIRNDDKLVKSNDRLR